MQSKTNQLQVIDSPVSDANGPTILVSSQVRKLLFWQILASVNGVNTEISAVSVKGEECDERQYCSHLQRTIGVLTEVRNALEFIMPITLRFLTLSFRRARIKFM